jgi:hypothetical protein
VNVTVVDYRMTGTIHPPLQGEVVIPHEVDIKPLTAVRNTLIQSSLGLLRHKGYFDRYSENIDPQSLQELSSNLAPSWVKIELAHGHYAACDAMQLSSDELAGLAQGVGQRVGETSIVVAGAKSHADGFDLWAVLGQLHRAWKRVFQGGSVQVVKLGPTEELIELRGFSLNQHRYFRFGNLGAVAAAHEAVGIRIESTKIVRYDSSTQDVTIHVAWT